MSRSALERADHKKIQMLLRQQQPRNISNNNQQIYLDKSNFGAEFAYGNQQQTTHPQQVYGYMNPISTPIMNQAYYLQQSQSNAGAAQPIMNPNLNPNIQAPNPLPYLPYPYLSNQTKPSPSDTLNPTPFATSFNNPSVSQSGDAYSGFQQTNILPMYDNFLCLS